MNRDHVLPFYVLCDESLSMTEHLDAVNEGLLELHQRVRADPVAAERTRLCLIGFSGAPEVRLPLSRMSDVAEPPALTVGAMTNYGAAFAFLRRLIQRDVELLTARCHRVCRPAVFFLSDGQPTDPATWAPAFAALTDPDWPDRPDVIAFGVGDSDGVTIGRIGTFRAFTSAGGDCEDVALRTFTEVLTESILRSAATPGTPRVPARISGFVAVPPGPG
jgi:uncharacterized protein YegL